ncbi:hypothetical protein [Ktedonospora formicarum]|uniref:Uncharacterized protein n=1 Tax=Ktedonospora formicarum TaxID=2778364 RepID=A0A8J3HXD7_9CHLR|nr:hypothetical protein [Ktedonospora formicarum]GHO42810.1 hypothetical protein KSX_09730 [Ktedonospora formicarum]
MEHTCVPIIIGIFTDLHRATTAVEQLCMAQFHDCTCCSVKVYIGSELTINAISSQELLEALHGSHESEEVVSYYMKEIVKRNRIAVVVRPPERAHEARDILLRQGAYNALMHHPCCVPTTILNVHVDSYNPNIPLGTSI